MYYLVGVGGANRYTRAGLSIKDRSRERSSNADGMVIDKPGKKFLTFPACNLEVG